MKGLNEYMAMSYRVEIVEDEDEGGFVVSLSSNDEISHIVSVQRMQQKIQAYLNK